MDKLLTTYTYLINKTTNTVQGYTALEGEIFLIQILDENWVQELVSGASVIELCIYGEDNLGSYEFHILVTGVPLSFMPSPQLLITSPENKEGVLLTLALTQGSEKFTPVIWPTTPAAHNKLGLYAFVTDKNIIARLQATRGKINHLWQKEKLQQPAEEYIKHMIAQIAGKVNSPYPV